MPNVPFFGLLHYFTKSCCLFGKPYRLQFRERLKAIGYDLDLVPSSFLDSISFDVMNNPQMIDQAPDHAIDLATLIKYGYKNPYSKLIITPVSNTDITNALWIAEKYHSIQEMTEDEFITLLPEKKLTKLGLKFKEIKLVWEQHTLSLQKQTLLDILTTHNIRFKNQLSLIHNMEKFVSYRESIFFIKNKLQNIDEHLKNKLLDCHLTEEEINHLLPTQKKSYKKELQLKLLKKLEEFIILTREIISAQVKDNTEEDILAVLSDTMEEYLALTEKFNRKKVIVIPVPTIVAIAPCA